MDLPDSIQRNMLRSLKRLRDGEQQAEWTFENAAGALCFVFVYSDKGVVRAAVYNDPVRNANTQPLFESVFDETQQSSWYYLRAAIECIRGSGCVCQYHDGAETPCCKRLQQMLALMGRMYRELREVKHGGHPASGSTPCTV